MTLYESEIMMWVASYFWPYCRIAGMFMVMVGVGSKNLSTRIRLLYSVAVTIVVAPTLGPMPEVDLFSISSFIIVVQQVLIGVALGFISVLVMQAFVVAGQVIGMQTSLGFASMIDPGSGQNVPVVGQFFLLLATLMFFAVDGHLAMIKMVVLSFDTLPVGVDGLTRVTFEKVARWGVWMFTAALAMSISAMVALLVINFSFGILTRAAPQLNIFSIGFPVTMLAGLLVLWLTLDTVMSHFDSQWIRGIEMMCQVINTRCDF
ncbi:flagellar biosynthetic protein FliR [Psychrobium sp. 1_MG-2023]|uniref:flagellar biosynthetic protein FliR n=1 Tax=Psychrobium sp. 1_MG-2023 TaxID=3062624 RepID=UPI000C32F568|nr:flagellar biosynthetic protein FliR [Psychrobium sp. 1_MG-2023]MDP2559826.1 flagellar biosynthetic protein FliR [Psychrobium sp. 1_MG-2023]PKF59070.1 flagellar biosynthetic protein FliR [Alteromonadales bacterium alter-6D02]